MWKRQYKFDIYSATCYFFLNYIIDLYIAFYTSKRWILEKRPSTDIKIWNGEKDTAILTNEAGEWSSTYTTSKMFDSNPQTCWHSARAQGKNLKIIGVHFNVSAKPFHFESLLFTYALKHLNIFRNQSNFSHWQYWSEQHVAATVTTRCVSFSMETLRMKFAQTPKLDSIIKQVTG